MENLFKLVLNTYSKIEFENFNVFLTEDNLDDEIYFKELTSLYLTKRNGKFKYKTQTPKKISHEEYEKNFDDLLMSLTHKRETICVDKNETKVSLKIFTYIKKRNVGSKVYSVETYCEYITYNYLTNTFYQGNIRNYHKKKKFTSSVKKNFFNDKPIQCLKNKIDYKLINGNVMDITGTDIINIFLYNIPNIKIDERFGEDSNMFKNYLDKNKIKYPNNWNTFLTFYPKPKKKDLVKYDYKYIDAIMGKEQLNGDKLKRILHTVNNCNFNLLRFSFEFFGKDFVLQQQDEVVKQIIESNNEIYELPNDIILTKKEKRNVFEIFKLTCYNLLDVYTFLDHIIYYRRLSSLENIKWKSNDLESFNIEHFEWGEKQYQYTYGESKRFYNQKFKKEVEKPIQLEFDYYPILLTNSEEYFEESSVQSNCVKTYIKSPSSVIISLRKHNNDSKERLTIEFNIEYNKYGKIQLKRGQTLARFNQFYTDDWKPILEILDNRIDNLIKNDIFELPEIETIVTNKSISSKLIFDNQCNGFKWENSVIDDNVLVNNINILEEV